MRRRRVLPALQHGGGDALPGARGPPAREDRAPALRLLRQVHSSLSSEGVAEIENTNGGSGQMHAITDRVAPDTLIVQLQNKPMHGSPHNHAAVWPLHALLSG